MPSYNASVTEDMTTTGSVGTLADPFKPRNAPAKEKPTLKKLNATLKDLINKQTTASNKE